MNLQSHALDRIRRFSSGGLDIIEYLGLLIIAFATTAAMYHEVTSMFEAKWVALADLLMMFLYLEVLAIRYGHIRFPYREDNNAAKKPYVRE